jgi:hypothetical protein
MVRGGSGRSPERLEGSLVAGAKPLLALLVAGFLPAEGFAAPPGATHYVAPRGDDAASGRSIYIRAGTCREQVTPQRSGVSGEPITYAACPGEEVTLDGSGLVVPADVGSFASAPGTTWARRVALLDQEKAT